MKPFGNPSINFLNYTQQKSSAVISQLQIKRTKWLFLALCFYIISQAYTIPIIPIGPWATWPNLPDFATGLLTLAFILNFFQKKPPASSSNQKIFLLLIIVLVGSIFSHLGYRIYLIDKDAAGTRLGIFQIYHLIQFICVFWVTAQIPLTPERINVLKQITTFVLIFVCLSILFTFAGIVPMGALTAHLPQDPGTAGPWFYFKLTENHGGKGWGTIGYNHAYVAVQVTMLAALRIHLGQGKQVIIDFCLLFLSLISCLVSESRAGFFAMIILAAIYMLKKPAYTGIVLTMSVLFLIIAAASLPNLGSIELQTSEGSIVERQATLLDAGNAENLSGRDEIWQDRLIFLNRQPMRWITGIGFGAAWDIWGSGESAHQLALHIILENGIFGLLIFCVLFYQILYSLYRYETADKAIYWTTIGLLLSALTQETFYPVPAFGHFIGLYLCSVAIALRSKALINSSNFIAE